MRIEIGFVRGPCQVALHVGARDVPAGAAEKRVGQQRKAFEAAPLKQDKAMCGVGFPYPVAANFRYVLEALLAFGERLGRAPTVDFAQCDRNDAGAEQRD